MQGQQLLFLVLSINTLGIGVVTLIYVRSVDHRGALRLWALSQVMLALGLMMLGLQAVILSDAGMIAAGTGVIFLGLAMQLSAYVRYALFRRRAHGIETILITGVLGLLFLTALSGQREQGALTAMLVIAVAQLAFVGVLVLSSRPRTTLLNILISAHAASAMAFMAMALEILGNPAQEWSHEVLLHSVAMLLSGLFPYVAGLSFLFLIKEDSDHELQESHLRIRQLNVQHEESERLHARKLEQNELETIAHLSAGVAHDFNNLLGIIENDTQFIEYQLRQQQQDDSTLEALDSIHSALGQARIVTSGMMVLNRNSPLVLETIDLEPILQELGRVVRPMLPDNVALTMRIDSGLVAASSRGFLQASLLNLLTNARDSMTAGGELVFEAGRTAQDPDAMLIIGSAEPGEKVLIRVSDTGSGIAGEILEKIFEPRFTTKRQGVGHGLGLFMVRRFVERAQAALAVDSFPGRGTTFGLYLPCAPPVHTAA